MQAAGRASVGPSVTAPSAGCLVRGRALEKCSVGWATGYLLFTEKQQGEGCSKCTCSVPAPRLAEGWLAGGGASSCPFLMENRAFQ